MQFPSKSEIELIILDRDGVINVDSVEYIKSPMEWRPILGSLEAIAKLGQAGYKIAVVTNQSGISRNYFTEEDLKAIHDKMQSMVVEVGGHIDGVFVCPHGPDDGCSCRKPKPGLLFEVSRTFNVPPEKILLVGDSMRDLQAAKAFGCRFILVLTGNGRYTLQSNAEILMQPFNEDINEDKKWIYPDLAVFAEEFLGSV